ncbi:putative membrane protein YvbJ [Breznakia sp. PFB2-8]|nr:putative membrane protein YvbJ [Breznakia sp. PFB2-8]MDF9858980.1 putative membrane protein YvbJ [Breznakia sp. PH5-24]
MEKILKKIGLVIAIIALITIILVVIVFTFAMNYSPSLPYSGMRLL